MLNLPKHANAKLDLSIENNRDIPIICAVCDALSSPVRLKILKCLQKPPFQKTIGEFIEELKIPKTTLIHHLKKLESVNMITEYYSTSSHGTIKYFGRDMQSANVCFYYNPPKENTNNTVTITQSLGVGHFSDFNGNSFSFATKEKNYHFINSCFIPERFDAQLVYTHRGIITYYFDNGVAKQHNVTELNLSLEICSEAPYHNNDYLSDITFWLNQKEIATFVCEGDYGDRRGAFNPDWWKDGDTQYGKLLVITVNEKGVFFNGKLYNSKVTISDLKLASGNKINLTFGNKDTAVHVGGFNIFGKNFGNYPQDINLSLTYSD